MYPTSEMPYSGIFVKNQFIELSQSINIEIHYLPRRKTKLLGSLFKYALFFLRFFKFLFTKYDIIHVHFFGYHYLLAVLYKFIYPQTKVVVTFHGSDSKNLNSCLLNYFVVKCDLAVAVGRDQKNELKFKLKNIKIILLPAGIDRNIFFKKSIIKEYDFIFVGNFFKAKGIELIINSIQSLNSQNVSFCFVGQGELLENLIALKLKYNVTVFPPKSQPEVSDLLNKSRFFVFPSLGDSFGLVVTEALYCGVPAIVSNIGGMKDQIQHNLNGYILEFNDSKCLTKYIKKCISLSKNDWLRLVENASNSNFDYSLKATCGVLKYNYGLLIDTIVN